MRKYTILLAAAPLALLAACGDKADDTAATDDTAMTDTMATGTATPAATDEDTPGPATKAADAGDVSGTYSFTGDDGAKRDVTINSADKSYSYTAADGTKKTGSYTVDKDGYRYFIKDYYGRPTYFAFRNGTFYELPDNVSLTGDMVVQGNRYARQETEMFSREPEPGSPVVPERLEK